VRQVCGQEWNWRIPGESGSGSGCGSGCGSGSGWLNPDGSTEWMSGVACGSDNSELVTRNALDVASASSYEKYDDNVSS